MLRVLDENETEYDALIVAAYLPEDELRAFAAALPEADVVLGGPTGQSLRPQKVGPTMLASATNKGKFVVQLEARAGGHADANGRRHGTHAGHSAHGSIAWTGEIVELNEQFADAPDQVTNLERYLAQLEQHDFAAAETGFAPALPATVPPGFSVAGSLSCRECHPDEYVAWQRSVHSHAWRTLERRGYHVEPYCQQCHTTAYGYPGGFVSMRSTPQRVNVGCESCHGPSQAHVAVPEVKTPFAAADRCLRCHDRENSPNFAYDPYWLRVQHGPRVAPAATQEAGAP